MFTGMKWSGTGINRFVANAERSMTLGSSNSTMSEEILEGTLVEIRYHEDGFLIARLDSGASVKGPMLWPEIGMVYTFHGEWENHPRFGRGFKFVDYEARHPTGIKAIQEYLEENADGVGPRLAERLTEAFGDQTLIVLKDSHEKVAEKVTGITKEHAEKISAGLKEIEAREKLTLTLKEMVGGTRIPKSAVHDIIKIWGVHAPDRIRSNPYELMTEIDRVGFTIADAIAKKVGFDPEGLPRVRAGLLYVLQKASREAGHVFLPKPILIQASAELLAIESAKVEAVLPKLITEAVIKVDGDNAYLPQLFNDESFVANKIKVLLKNDESLP
ncbi:MAG: ATP-dependent RecD-like DNA helicase [Elusimicrobia bacterium]|nr:ATP-dependent RecD-like DNA helicase [Elusimicrobiota bacterium]